MFGFFAPGRQVIVERNSTVLMMGEGIMLRPTPNTWDKPSDHLKVGDVAVIVAMIKELNGIGPWLLLLTNRGCLGWSASSGVMEVLRE